MTVDQATFFEWFGIAFSAYCGFICGAAWMIWKTRDWDEPRSGIETTGTGDRPPRPRR